jgi:hypothetical protein
MIKIRVPTEAEMLMRSWAKFNLSKDLSNSEWWQLMNIYVYTYISWWE